jgi:hypothetical protein
MRRRYRSTAHYAQVDCQIVRALPPLSPLRPPHPPCDYLNASCSSAPAATPYPKYTIPLTSRSRATWMLFSKARYTLASCRLAPSSAGARTHIDRFSLNCLRRRSESHSRARGSCSCIFALTDAPRSLAPAPAPQQASTPLRSKSWA